MSYNVVPDYLLKKYIDFGYTSEMIVQAYKRCSNPNNETVMI